MHLAASVGALALIELLLLNGANPDIRDFEGRLPLHWATIQHNTKTITLLLQV
jgi:ankyrin repeat protein